MKKTEVLEKVNALGDDAELIVRTPDEELAFLNNYGEVYHKKKGDEWKDQEVRTWHERLEKDIQGVIGKTKPVGMKSYEWNKQILADLNTQAAEVAELREKLKNNAGDEQLKKEIKSLQEKYERAVNEHKASVSKLEKENQSVRIGNAIDRELIGIKFAPGLPDAAKDAFLKEIRQSLIDSSKYDENGSLVFLDDKGEILRNTGTMKPLTASEVVSEKVKPIIDPGVQRRGTDTGGEDDKGGGKSGVYALPANITTRTQLREDLLKSGFVSGSKEFAVEYNKHGENLKP